MASIKGIDVSKWQGNIDFSKVKSSTNFVIMKATEGYGYTDPKFKDNQKGFRNTGIAMGYYHFARPDLGNTPEKEADWFVKTIGALKSGEVLALDYEVNYSDPVNWCKKFLDRVKAKTGVKPLLYINLATNNKYNWSSVVKGDYGLWLAYWDGSLTARPKTDWNFIAIKQYGADTKVSGISGNVDGDVFFGDITTFKKYGYNPPPIPPTPPTPPEPTPEPPPEPPLPVPTPTDPTEELKKRIVTLEKEIEGLKTALGASGDKNTVLEGQIKGKDEEIKKLKAEMEQSKKDIQEWIEKFGSLQVKYSTLENSSVELVSENQELKLKLEEGNKIFIEKILDWVVGELAKIFKKKDK